MLTDEKMTVVVYMGMTAAPSVRAGLLAAGRSPQTPVGVFARVTRPDAQAVVGTLDELPALVEKIDGGPADSHHRRRGRALRAVASNSRKPRSTRLIIIWKPPNDLSARTEKNQDHRPVDRHRQPHLGRRRDLSHRAAGLVGGLVGCGDRSHLRRSPRAAGRIRWPTMSARSAPISRRSKSRTAARSSPAICVNISGSKASPSIFRFRHKAIHHVRI